VTASCIDKKSLLVSSDFRLKPEILHFLCKLATMNLLKLQEFSFYNNFCSTGTKIHRKLQYTSKLVSNRVSIHLLCFSIAIRNMSITTRTCCFKSLRFTIRSCKQNPVFKLKPFWIRYGKCLSFQRICIRCGLKD